MLRAVITGLGAAIAWCLLAQQAQQGMQLRGLLLGHAQRGFEREARGASWKRQAVAN